MIYGNINDNNVVQFIKLVDCLPLMLDVNGANYDLQPVHNLDLSEAYFQALMNKNAATHNIRIRSEPLSLRNMILNIERCFRKRYIFRVIRFLLFMQGLGPICLTLNKKDYKEKFSGFVSIVSIRTIKLNEILGII